MPTLQIITIISNIYNNITLFITLIQIIYLYKQINRRYYIYRKEGY
jgi:hypothetical protein